MPDADVWPAVARSWAVDKWREVATGKPEYIGVGTGTNPAADGDTDLQSEIETPRLQGTMSRPDVGKFSITGSKTFTGNADITEAAVLTALTGGTLKFRSTYDPGDTVSNGHVITYKWDLLLLAG